MFDRRSSSGRLGALVRGRACATVLALTVLGPAPGASAQAAPESVDPGARMLDGDAAGEAWDVVARLDDGSRYFARFWVTNEGPGTHTGIAMGHFVRPDGSVSRFRYGRARDRWQLGAAGRYLEVASAVLDLRAPSATVAIDTDKGGMKIYLRFAIPETPQPICARRESESGFDVIRLQESVDGIAWVKGMAAPIAARGKVDVTHSWSNGSEIDTVLRRIDASGSDGDVAFFATTVVAPQRRGQPRSCVAILVDGERVYQTFDAGVEVATAALGGGEESYPVSSKIVFGNDRLALAIDPSRETLRIDPLEVIPQPFRMLLRLRASPRRVWAEADWSLRFTPENGRGAVERRDVGSVAIGYSNPW